MLPLLGVAALVILVVAGMRLLRRLFFPRLKRAKRAKRAKCPCGYPLAHLDVARCPECGRVIGFDATAEELGLTFEQLQRVQAKRQAREAERRSTQA